MTLLTTALARHRSGHYPEAEALYRTVLRDDARNGDALHYLGVLCLETGRLTEAEALIRAALGIRDAAEFRYHLGLVLTGVQRPMEAMDAYRRALDLQPEFPQALCNLGSLLCEQGRSAEAVAAFRRALGIRPEHPEALSNLGLELQEQGKVAEAVAAFRMALALRPDYPEVLYNLARGLEALGLPGGAIAAARRALVLRPDYTEVFPTLGNALREAGDLERSVSVHRRGLALRPAYPEALSNFGGTLQDQGRLDEAIAVHGWVLRSHPDFPDAHFNLSLALLLGGDFERGWAEYEWRWRQRGFASDRLPLLQPRWRGEPARSARGWTLLVHAEQGLGDSLQFIRYVPAILARGWRVAVEVPRPLLRLFGCIPGIGLIAQGDERPPFLAHCPMLSLPHALGTTRHTIPADIPYLRAEPEQIAAWGERLPQGFRIGVAWQGNPQGKVDRGRSYPLASLAPLARVPGVRLISLQKGHGLDHLDRLPEGMAVTSLGADFDGGPDAFVDTAAVMMNLDLIVTSDTSIAHLAGALGRPVWLALKAVPDWRWMMHGDDSPWYPTMRLFRQTVAGDWEPVFRRMAEELSRLVSSNR